MSQVANGLVFSLHAALADGYSPGIANSTLRKWYDISPYNNHSDLNNVGESVWVGQGSEKAPYALHFNGTGSYVNCGAANIIKPSTDVTLEVSFKRQGGKYLVFSDALRNVGYDLFVDTGGILKAILTTSTAQGQLSLGPIKRDLYYHVAVSLNSNNGEIKGYINGEFVAAAATIEGEYTPSSSSAVLLGKNVSSDYFWGDMELVRVYSKPLSANEIQTNFSTGHSVYEGGADLNSAITVKPRADLQSQITLEPKTKIVGYYNPRIFLSSANLSSTIAVQSFVGLTSTIRVPYRGMATVNYKTIPWISNDLHSSVVVNPRSELEGHLNIFTQTVRVTSNYTLIRYPSTNLQSSVHVKQTHDTIGSVFINPYTKVRAHYRTIEFVSEDLTSSIYVREVRDLIGSVRVNISNRAVANYGIQETSINDLVSAISIFTPYLKGKLAVRSRGLLKSFYGINRPGLSDVNSSITVYGQGSNTLPTNLKVSSSTALSAKYNLVKNTVEDLYGDLQVARHENLVGSAYIFNSRLRANYRTLKTGKADLNSTLVIPYRSSLPSSMEIPLKTSLTATYKTVATESDDLRSRIRVMEHSNLSGHILINPYTRMSARYSMIGNMRHSILSSMDIKAVYQMPSSLSIATHGKMTALTDIVDRVRIYDEIKPIQDAFVDRERPSENFGDFDELRVSSTQKSVLQFQLVDRDFDTKLVRASLRLYLKDGSSTGISLKVLQGEWQENSVTWDNLPDSSSRKEPSVITEQYVEFDVTEFIHEWETASNYGVELSGSNTTFYSTESGINAPELNVEYLDLRNFTFKEESLASHIKVVANGQSDLNSSINLVTGIEDIDLPGSISPRDPKNMESSITVHRPNLYSYMAARQNDFKDLDGRAVVKQSTASDLTGSILLNVKERPGSLFVLFTRRLKAHLVVRQLNTSSINASITIRQEEESDLISEIAVQRYENHDLPSVGYLANREDVQSTLRVSQLWMYGSIEVKARSDIAGQLIVEAGVSEDLSSDVTVTNREDLFGHLDLFLINIIPGNLFVRSGNLASHIGIPFHSEKDLLSSFTARLSDHSELTGNLKVISGNLNSHVAVRVNHHWEIDSSFNVRLADYSNLDGSAVVNALGSEDLPSHVTNRKQRDNDAWSTLSIQRYGVSPPVLGSMTVRAFGKLDTLSFIAARQTDQSSIQADITVRQSAFSDLNGNMFARSVSQIASNIKIYSHTFGRAKYSMISVGNSDLESSIFVTEVSELPSNIKIRSRNRLVAHYGNIPFPNSDIESMLGVAEWEELEGSITVRSHTHVKAHYTLQVFGEDDLPVSMSIYEVSDIPGDISARQTDKSDLLSSIQVFEVSDLPTSLGVSEWNQIPGYISVWEKYLIPGHIAARQSDESDLNVSISAYQVSDLDSVIYVAQRSEILSYIEVMTAYPYAFIL